MRYSHRAVSAGAGTQRDWDGALRLTFDYNLGEHGEAMLMDYVRKGTATVVHEGEFGSLVRTIIELRIGQRPVIITSIPVFK